MNILTTIIASLVAYSALATPAKVSYQGRIFTPQGDPVESGNVSLVTQVLDPSGQCLLYEESHSISMEDSAGFFSLNVGSGSKNTTTAPNFTLPESLSNATVLAHPQMGCSGNSYSPDSDDNRLLRVSIDGDTLSPDQVIQSVPYALFANESATLDGQTYSDIKQYTDETFAGTSLPDLSSISDGQALRWNSGGWQLFTPGTSSVTAGNGLEVSGSDFLVKAGTNISVNASGVHVVQGASSGLDADLLDGNNSSYYLDYTNMSNTPAALTALTGDVSASGPGSTSATVNNVGGSTASAIHTATQLANAATNANTASAIVRRDISGDFSANTITADVVGNVTGTATNVTGTVTISNGGTGVTAIPTNGQILIGNGSGYTVATLSAGTGITITNNSGSITVSVGSGSSGLRSCDTGNPDDVMVEVGTWCVDKYEASVWSNSDGSGTDYFTDSTTGAATDFRYPTGAANVPAGCNRDGSGCGQYAVSKPGVIPSRGLTWYQASRFCANAGKVLIPDGVWQTAVIGTSDPDSGTGTGGTAGGSTSDGAAAQCNIDTHVTTSTWTTSWLRPSNGVRLTARAGSTPGSTNACISDFGVEDMVGNLWEWTNSNGIPAGEDQTAFTEGEGNPDGAPFSTFDATWNVDGSTYSCDGVGTTKGNCGWKNNVPAAASRGGHWSVGINAGVYTINLYSSGTDSTWGVGFRCARPR